MAWSDHHHVFHYQTRMVDGRIQYYASCVCNDWKWPWAGPEALPFPEAAFYAHSQLEALWMEHYNSCYK